MSETPIRKFDWSPHGMEEHPSGWYIHEDDADARDKERMEEIERLRVERDAWKEMVDDEIACTKELMQALDIEYGDGPVIKELLAAIGSMKARITALESACEVLGAYAAAKLEGQRNHIRQAKRGTGVLQAWQQRCSRAKEAMLAHPLAPKYVKERT